MTTPEYTPQTLYTVDKALSSEELSTLVQQTAGNNFYRTSDGYNVFEFYAMDISQTYDVAPSFIPIISGNQFSDVSAVAIITAPAINFSKLFKFKSDDTINLTGADLDWDESNVSLNNMYFGCEDTSAFFNSNIEYSNASVTVNLANKSEIYKNNTTIKQDFVRHLAKSITGGYALSEIFVNEKQLMDGVENMDEKFNASMREIIEDSIDASEETDERFNGLFTGSAVQGNQIALSCQNLVANLFALNVSFLNGESNGNEASWARGQRFLEDLSNQTTADISDNEFYVKFRDRDVLALRLTYAPFGSVNGLDNNTDANYSAPGSNPIYSRSYKVYIVMEDKDDYPVEPNPRPWDPPAGP